MSATTIYQSCQAANDALGPCPRPLANSDGGHWWYVDINALQAQPAESDYIPCICKSCPQTMHLDADAEEFPL